MVMTDEEIIREYAESKNKSNQIKILADENLCRQADIVAILRAAGQPVPNMWLSKKEKEEKVARLAAAAGVKAPVPKPPKKDEPAENRTEPPKPATNAVRSEPANRQTIAEAAIEAIAKRLRDSYERTYDDRADDVLERSSNFREQVRGILALVYELNG